MALAILDVMLGCLPLGLGSFVVFSTLFRYPKPEAKYARLAAGVLGAYLMYAGVHILLKSK